ncbi:MAG: hypothetical protein HQK54_01250, partial [Oligoflexales bacterium]|nr:hypothetical protein [Oligoflexales bacterium]
MSFDNNNINFVLTTSIFIISITAYSNDNNFIINNKTGIKSKAHIGFSIENDSSTGFKNSGGSIVIFDLTKSINSELEVGVQSWGSGASHKGLSYYRLSSGPLFTYNIPMNWLVYLS